MSCFQVQQKEVDGRCQSVDCSYFRLQSQRGSKRPISRTDDSALGPNTPHNWPLKSHFGACTQRKYPTQTNRKHQSRATPPSLPLASVSSIFRPGPGGPRLNETVTNRCVFYMNLNCWFNYSIFGQQFFNWIFQNLSRYDISRTTLSEWHDRTVLANRSISSFHLVSKQHLKNALVSFVCFFE